MGNTDREKQTGLAVTAPNRSRPLGGERTGLAVTHPRDEVGAAFARILEF